MESHYTRYTNKVELMHYSHILHYYQPIIAALLLPLSSRSHFVHIYWLPNPINYLIYFPALSISSIFFPST